MNTFTFFVKNYYFLKAGIIYRMVLSHIEKNYIAWFCHTRSLSFLRRQESSQKTHFILKTLTR